MGELDSVSPDEINVISRPREGDLIYFPLGGRLFEVKFVEHEQPFYQLGKNYVYQLKCELFEYSDEFGGWDQLSTTTEEIDSVLEDQGYITSILMIGAGTTATAVSHIGTGYVRQIFLNEKGKKLFEEIFLEQKKRIYNALKNSDSDSVLKFRNVLKKIIND